MGRTPWPPPSHGCRAAARRHTADARVAPPGALTVASHPECPVIAPAHRGIRSSPPELFPNRSKRLPLAVAQPYTTHSLLAQDTVFCDEIFMAKQQFLVHRARDVSQHVRPLHMSPLLRSCGFLSECIWGIAGGKSRQGADGGKSINAGEEMHLGFWTLQGAC